MNLIAKIIFPIYLWVNVFSLIIFLVIDIININSKRFKSKFSLMDKSLKKRKYTTIRIRSYLKQLTGLKEKNNSNKVQTKIKETEELIEALITELSKIDYTINNLEEEFYEIKVYRIYSLISCILPIIHIRYLAYRIFDLVEITKRITN